MKRTRRTRLLIGITINSCPSFTLPEPPRNLTLRPRSTNGFVVVLYCCPLGTHDSCPQFNLETPDAEIFKEPLRPYRSLSSAPSPLPFELQVLLSVPDLSANQVLVCRGADSSRLRIEPTPKFILLESWSIQFSPRRGASGSGGGDAADLGLSTVYKHGIGLFRSIYTLLRVLPTWKLHKRLRRRVAVPSNRNANLNIELRVRSGRDQDGVLGFGKPPFIDMT